MGYKTNNKRSSDDNIDAFYFKKYSRYVKQYGSVKAGINLFLTLKKCRNSSYVHIHKRYERSFLHILQHYKMKYESHIDEEDPDRIFYILSHKSISDDVKHAFHDNAYDTKNPHIMGSFLDYPAFINVKEVHHMKSIGSIKFYCDHDSLLPSADLRSEKKVEKSKRKELIYGFRIPNSEITPKMIAKMNRLVKKYQKCVNTLNPSYTIELNVRM